MDKTVEVTRDEALALDHLIRSSRNRISSNDTDVGKAIRSLLESASLKFTVFLNQDDG